LRKKQKKQNFSDRLRQTREDRGLTRGVLARKLGLSDSTQISRYESSKAFPAIPAIQKLAEILDIDLHWLICGKPSPNIAELANCVRPYAIAHLSEITIRLQKYERERRDLYARNAQGESLEGAIRDIETLIQKETLYYKKAWEDLDAALDLKTH
jgi:transcriptional regulator with XRE-family HTH domain